MRVFVKSVMTGFAFSLGAALFRKVAPKLGLEDKERAGKKDAARAGQSEASTDKIVDGDASEPAEPAAPRTPHRA